MLFRHLSYALGMALMVFGPAEAQVFRTDNTEAELIAERAAIAPSTEVQLGLRLRHREHWHSYWRNPGDSGLATEISWTLPPGWKASEIDWPAPHKIDIGSLSNYGYEGEFVLPIRLQVPADAKLGSEALIVARANWLVCEKICIPEEAEFRLSLPITSTPGSLNSDHAALFATALQNKPLPAPWPGQISGNGDHLRLTLDAPSLASAKIVAAYFFPHDPNALRHAAPQILTMSERGITLELERGVDRGTPVQPLTGVLRLTETLDAGQTAEQVFLVEASASVATPNNVDSLGLAQAILFALLGGTILNLMPCVFPILFIKGLSLARLGGIARREVKIQGLAYTAGVLVTFTALGAALLSLKFAGAVIGWGFQLQEPLVILLLAYLMAAIGFNLSGLFEINGIALEANGTAQGGRVGAFLTGALAVLVATPCTAPFMGAALGYALVQPPAIALTIFMMLGLGMALPFLGLSLFPALAQYLPKPGSWMLRFKQGLAFPMFATVAWLVWVLTQQAGPDAMFMALLGILGIGFAGWLWGLSQTAVKQIGWRIAAVIVLLAALTLGRWIDPGLPENKTALTSSNHMKWAKFDEAEIAAARSNGQPVLVNLTAAWCITCLVNEAAALSSERVMQTMTERRVLAMKGDWTNRDAAITRYLEQFGRSGVPLYVLYPSDKSAPPELLPQILTESLLLDSLSKL